MLNFYNYYDKIHPELMKKLKELETKNMSGSADNNDTLVIMGKNASKADEEQVKNGEESKYFKGKRILYDESAWNEASDETLNNNTLNISDSDREYIIKNVTKIIVYHRNSLHHIVFYKIESTVDEHFFSTFGDPINIRVYDDINKIIIRRPE